MRSLRHLLAIPLVLATSVLALASEVRDKAKLFSPDAIKKAETELQRIERETNVPVTIETVSSLEGRNIDDAMKELGRREGIKGLFVLIAVKEKKNDAGASTAYDSYFRKSHYHDAYSGFLPGFKKGDFDLGLAEGVTQIEKTLQEVKTEAGGTITPKATHTASPRGLPGPTIPPVQHNVPRQINPQRGGSGIMTLVWIVGGILLVMFVLRIIGAMMGGGNRGYGGQGPMGGPGYGGPGYGGGGGGGFMSSLFGGIGGAMAGNWLYDQFSGRHRGGGYDEGYVPPAGGEAPPTETGGGDWGGTAGDGGGSWGDSGGSGGGGGDWGGGGGDAGGGGGDWGGGGGGGDWGGGGGDGGGGW